MRINLLTRLAAIALLSAMCAVAVSAQIATASGKITMKQADGTLVPVQGATVVFYRTDIKSKVETKTDKNGVYTYAGLNYVGTYTIAVSAPNARPDFGVNLRISQRPENNFTLEPGDGNTLTLEQINALAAKSSGGGGAAASAEVRKAREKQAAEIAAINAENEKAAATNVKLGDILKTGNAAFSAKNYDQAIATYDQGIQADPTQAVFYSNKSMALRSRAIDRYNTAAKTKDKAGINAAREDFKTATELADKAVTTYRANKAKNASTTAPASGTPQKEELNNFLMPRVETYRIALQINTPNVADAATKAFKEYIAVETDPVKKGKAEASLAEALYLSGQTDQAIASYRAILSSDPNNLDAIYGLGIALAGSETTAAEARDMLKRYVAKAPADDPHKADAASAIEALNEALKAAPVNTDTGKGKNSRRKG